MILIQNVYVGTLRKERFLYGGFSMRPMVFPSSRAVIA